MQEYAEEIQKLHRDLKASREKNGIYLTEDSYRCALLFLPSNTEQPKNVL